MDYINVAVRQLPTGATPRRPIFSLGGFGSPLLQPGQVVSENLVQTLIDQAIEEVQVHAEDLTAWGMPTILLETKVFDRRCWTECTWAIERFVKHLTQGCTAEPECERRKHKRYRINRAVAVQPLDEHFRPTGTPFLAVCRDLSAGGLSLIHTRAARESFLLVELPRPQGSPARMIMQVTRCRTVVRFYEIAGPLAATYLGAPISNDAPAAERASDGLRRRLKMRLVRQVRDAAAAERQGSHPQGADGGKLRYRDRVDSGLNLPASQYSISREELTEMLMEILQEQSRALP